MAGQREEEGEGGGGRERGREGKESVKERELGNRERYWGTEKERGERDRAMI